MESMDYFHKSFDSSLAICRLMGCNATIFPGLEKQAENIKDAGKCIAAMCLIKKSDTQRLCHL